MNIYFSDHHSSSTQLGGVFLKIIVFRWSEKFLGDDMQEIGGPDEGCNKGLEQKYRHIGIGAVVPLKSQVFVRWQGARWFSKKHVKVMSSWW